MSTRIVIIIVGVGAGLICYLGVLLLPGKSPRRVNLRPPEPLVSLAVSPPRPTAAPSTENDAEVLRERAMPRRKRVSREMTEFRNTMSEHILAAMASTAPANQDVIYALLAQWMQRDAVGAGRFAETLPAGIWREVVIRRVAQEWAAQDPLEAERWAAWLPEAGERDAALADVCFRIAQTDARQAVEIAQRHGLGAAPGGVVENLVQQWARQDFDASAAWINEQPVGEQRDQMVARLAYVQSQTEPAAAADLVAGQIPAGPIQNEAAISVLHQWATRDLASATGWVNRFPPGTLRDRAEAELQGVAAYAR